MLRGKAPETREALLRVRSRRVFIVRLAIGMALLRLGFWIMGARAEAAE